MPSQIPLSANQKALTTRIAGPGPFERPDRRAVDAVRADGLVRVAVDERELDGRDRVAPRGEDEAMGAGYPWAQADLCW